ncbi:Tm1 [Trypoxylus dichotomus]
MQELQPREIGCLSDERWVKHSGRMSVRASPKKDGGSYEIALRRSLVNNMSQRVGSGNTRKRGHQHHPRNHGTRRRSALEPTISTNNEITPSLLQQQRIATAAAAPNLETSKSTAVTPPIPIITSSVIQSASSVNNNNNKNKNKNSNVNNNTASSAVVINNKSKDHDPIIKEETSDIIDLTNCDDTDDISSPSSTETRKKCTVEREENDCTLYIPSVEEGKDMSLVFRPAAEGSSQSDQESEDPEIEELSRLRCTSERTEVIAEREIRKRGRRCADYPGLAFGSSIFSSDTLMKFSIIRNELHNIMNTQLKRGSLLDVLKKKMRQTKEEMERYKDECENYNIRYQNEVVRREEVRNLSLHLSYTRVPSYEFYLRAIETQRLR